jgi:hypothetical protein
MPYGSGTLRAWGLGFGEFTPNLSSQSDVLPSPLPHCSTSALKPRLGVGAGTGLALDQHVLEASCSLGLLARRTLLGPCPHMPATLEPF